VPREDAIQVEGTVIEILKSTVFRVELPNRHRILAHVTGKMRLGFVRLELGARVTVEMSPYDLSKGWITNRQAEI